ncbi:MAG: hypothetical protein II649_04075 [Kiritimatiellae bacterium]|nr:hypothetical protein [Kiritimatiellia bacterium]
MRKIVMMLGAAALLPLHADTYQFIISGDPVAAATADSHAVASAATSLETATRSGGSAASALEARYRTWDESDGIALRSDEYRGMMIYIR